MFSPGEAKIMNTNHKSQLKSLLMIRELIFLVGTILVSVTSEQICSVCGDGYQVGNPSAISSFPGHPDTPTSCKEIEVAGLQELIPISQCRSLPSLIFEACNCQAKTTEKTREKVNALNGPGYSSLRRVQAASPAVASSDLPVATPTSPVFSSSVVAASIVVSPVSPVAPANAVYGGSPVAAPSVYQYSESPHNFYADKQRMDLSIIILALTIVGICFAFAVCSIIATRSGSRIATPQALPTFVISVPASSVVMNGRPAISIGTNGRGLDEDAKRRRTLVLGVLFPNEGKVCTTYLCRAVHFWPCHRKRKISDASLPLFPQDRRKNRRDFYSTWGKISCRIETLLIL